MREDIEKKYNDLVDSLNRYRRQYYNENNSEISDQEYDRLYKELESIEHEYPYIKRKDSPTYEVGYKVDETSPLTKVQHRTPMLSLGNLFTVDEVKDFIANIYEMTGSYPEFIAEPKLDGLSLSLIYDNRQLVKAVTRGDGNIGESVLHIVQHVKSIPKRIPLSERVEVRGEILIKLDEFNRLNKIRQESGEPLFKHPRNLASGTIRTLDENITNERELTFVGYQVIRDNNPNSCISDDIDLLESMGFIPNLYRFTHVNHMVVIDDIKEWGERYKYPLDGVVFKVNNYATQEMIGWTSRTPKWAIAYKYPSEEKVTRIKNVVHTVGRTGRITPVAEIEPVNLSGATVSNVTLHNYSDILEKDIHYNDYVLVTRSAEVIPYVVRSLPEMRDYSSQELIEAPNTCPSCGNRLKNDGKILYCTNDTCPDRLKGSLLQFISREGMNIEGMGDKILDKLIGAGYIKRNMDLYDLEPNIDRIASELDISPLVLRKIVESSKESKKNTPLSKVITALGIPLVGNVASKLLSKSLESLDNIAAASKDDLKSIDGIGDVVANSIIDYFSKEENKKVVKELKDRGFNTKYQSKFVNNEYFKDKTFVITGSFDTYDRDTIKNIINDRGGNVSSSVSKKTDVLIYGTNAGSKLSKAKELNVLAINEKEFLDFLKLDKN